MTWQIAVVAGDALAILLLVWLARGLKDKS